MCGISPISREVALIEHIHANLHEIILMYLGFANYNAD
jgi:hypothetical protein